MKESKVLLTGLAQWSQDRPFVLAVLGPNGSGKSSIEHELGIGDRSLVERVRHGRAFIDEETGKLGILMVNPDAIAANLLAKNPGLGVDEANRAAQKEAERLRNELAARRADFAFETVGSHPSKVEFLKKLKLEGYNVAVLAVSTESPDINVRRVAQRVALGGHDVPEEKIVARYERTSNLLIAYYQVSDLFVAYDNSRDAKSAGDPSARLVMVRDGSGLHIEPAAREVGWINRFVLEKIR